MQRQQQHLVKKERSDDIEIMEKVEATHSSEGRSDDIEIMKVEATHSSVGRSIDIEMIMKQVEATHSSEGRDMVLEPILHFIEKTLDAIPASIERVIHGTHNGNVNALAGEEKTALPSFDDVNVIHKISCQFSCKCSGEADADASTIAILKKLSDYTWEAKVVISLGAFSVNIGEFWLLAQLFTTNDPLAKSVAMLKQLPNIIEHYKTLEPRFDTVNVLIKAVLEVIKCIIAFKNLPYQYLQDDTPPKSTALTHIPTAAYWCIKSMVACATQLTSLLGMNYEYMTATWDASKLSLLTDIVLDIHKHHEDRLHLEEKQHEYFQKLVKNFDGTQSDNSEIIKDLLCAKENFCLLDCSSKTMVDVNVLSKKIVLLLISDLEISDEEVQVLTQIYMESKSQQDLKYEVVWVPVVDHLMTREDSHKGKLEKLQSMMEWNMLQDPKLLEPAVIKYIKQVWHFEKKPILVVLDQQGRVASLNALHMVWIWRNIAYPFTSKRENALWEKESWSLNLLVKSSDKRISQLIGEEKYICLYGGGDLNWIKSFTKSVAEFGKNAGNQLEMVYVGKSGTIERIRKMCATITEEKLLNHTLPDSTSVWYYWTRLESMLYSKMQHGKSYENDPIMKEVMTMMSFDGSDKGWAYLICKESSEMARANSDLVWKSLIEYKKWEKNAKKGFVQALRVYLAAQHTSDQHCIRLRLPAIIRGIPEVMVCWECGRTMEKFFMFRCCTD